MPDKNYNQISWNIWNHCADKLTEWEEQFIYDMLVPNRDYTDKQKEVILKINRKYIAQR